MRVLTDVRRFGLKRLPNALIVIACTAALAPESCARDGDDYDWVMVEASVVVGQGNEDDL